MHHNQHTASLTVAIHLPHQLRVIHRRQLKVTHQQATHRQVTPRARVVHTLHLVPLIPHLVPTPLNRATMESKIRAVQQSECYHLALQEKYREHVKSRIILVPYVI